MKVIETRNVNTALAQAIPYLIEEGKLEDSRNGKVLVAPGPVVTVYHKPKERVVFSPTRDANPFFHLMESLWMLAGREDLALPVTYNKRFEGYSDDGHGVWGAYGWRWRQFFGYDQLDMIINELKNNPESRRCVLSMWNPSPNHEHSPWQGKSDLYVAQNGGKDVPCNTHAYFDMRDYKLNMTVCCRSNDVMWGAYGANAVHFSFLQEYIAAMLDMRVGEYRQFSNNFHVYTDIYSVAMLERIAGESQIHNYYNLYPELNSMPAVSSKARWHEYLHDLLTTGHVPEETDDIFLASIAAPMCKAWRLRKSGDVVGALNTLEEMAYSDWKLAALDWVKRRER